MAVDFAKVRDFIRQRGAGMALEMTVNFVLPFLIYDLGKARLGDVHALMASSIPPIVWSLIEFARKRRVDALSIIVLTGIALSLLAFLGGGGARFLQLREKLVTGLIGLGFLGSVLIRRPLIYEFIRATLIRQQSSELALFESRKNDPGLRRTMNLMTLVWGCGLVADAAAGCALVMTLSIRDYLLVSPMLGYGTAGALGLWTFWYAKRARARGEARRASEAAAQAAAAGTEATA
jgi:hypothetical protein